MKAVHFSAVAALVAGVSLAVAAPASAEALSGTYSSTSTNASGATATATYVFTPCGPDCASRDSIPPNPDNVRVYHLQGDTWSYSSDGGGTACGESLNKDTLAGNYSCGMMTFPVQLTKVG